MSSDLSVDSFYELLTGVAYGVHRLLGVHKSKCEVQMQKEGRNKPEDIFNELLFPFTRSHYACPYVSFVWQSNCHPRFGDVVDFLIFLVSRCQLSAQQLAATYACFEYAIERGSLHVSFVTARRLLLVFLAPPPLSIHINVQHTLTHKRPR